MRTLMIFKYLHDIFNTAKPVCLIILVKLHYLAGPLHGASIVGLSINSGLDISKCNSNT